MFNWFIENKPSNRAGRILEQIKAAMKTAVSDELFEKNPFDRFTKKITELKKSGRKEGDKHFEIDEAIAVIEAFRNHPTAKHYAPIVEFIFLTGMRPNELTAWQKSASQSCKTQLENCPLR